MRRSPGAVLFVAALASVVGCGRAAAPATDGAPGGTGLATQATASAATPSPVTSGAHVHTGPLGIETILGVRVLELTSTSLRGQWNQEQVLLRSGPTTRFAQVDPDGQVRFDTGHDFATAGIRTGDRLNLAVDWSDRSADGAYLVILATKL